MIYVIIQFGCIFYLVFNTRFEYLDALGYGLIGIALVIGFSAVTAMELGNLNVVPTLKDQHQLVIGGIYRWIRHPMYTSVLTICLAFTLTNNHQLSQFIMLILLVNLVLKSNLEEKLLTQRFDSYQDYKSKTGRFIPFL